MTEHSASSSGEPLILEYWQVLRRRRKTVLIATTVLLALAIMVSLVMTPRYKTDARISVGKEGADAFGFKDEGAPVPVDEAEYNMQLDAQVKILNSDTVVLETLKHLGLVTPSPLSSRPEANHPESDHPEVTESKGAPPLSREQLTLLRDYHDRLEVSRVGHTPLIEIHFSGPNPKATADFLNRLLAVYIEQNFQTRYESTQQVSSWLSQQLGGLKAKVEESDQKLAVFEKENGILGVDDKQNIITQKLDELNHELTSAQEDRVRQEALYRATETGDPELIPGAGESQIIKQLKDQRAVVANNYAQATAAMGPAHPQVIQLKHQLDEIDAELRQEFQKSAERNRNGLVVAERREQMLSSVFDEQKKAANQLNAKATEYEILKHDAESNQQLYDGLSQKLKEAGLSAGLKSGNIRVLDYARTPFSPSSPNIPLNLALALVLGCVGGSTLAFVQERLDKTLRSPFDVRSVTPLPLMGVVPLIPGNTNGRDRRLGARERDKAVVISHTPAGMQLLESYRGLRTSILMSSEAPPKVIMITSPLPYEGKTTTSINCAMVLAQKGERVLLIDADLRAPRIHEVLGLSSTCGLSTLLEEKPDVRDRDAIVQYFGVPNLFVLPAGPLSKQPARLLDSGIMKKKMAEWRKVFTHIVIDTPPVLSSSDGLILSAEADAVLLTILANQTPKAALLRAHDILSGVNARVSGVVVNGVDFTSGFSTYGEYNYGVQPGHTSA